MRIGRAAVVWGLAVAILIAAAAAIVLRAASVRAAGGVREIRLVARGMAFYVDDGGNDPNPILRLGRGERVRIVLRNDDPGMSHDFAVRAWNVGTSRIEYQAEAGVELRAPEAAGLESYGCTPHGELMRGTLKIE